MLVLSRKKGESIVIGDNVTLTVVEVRGDCVRLGITAPREVRIDRSEVRERMNSQASMSNSAAKPDAAPESRPVEQEG